MLIIEYQESWIDNFEMLRKVLSENLDSVDVKIEHIGSTSVHGMHAKSIIDIDIIYNKKDDFKIIKEKLEKLGYFHNGDQGIEGREVFKWNTQLSHTVLDGITHHLYVCHKDSKELKRHLHFRNYLRENEEARSKYTKMKLDLATQANQDKKTYASLKEKELSTFINECIEKQENGK